MASRKHKRYVAESWNVPNGIRLRLLNSYITYRVNPGFLSGFGCDGVSTSVYSADRVYSRLLKVVDSTSDRMLDFREPAEVNSMFVDDGTQVFDPVIGETCTCKRR
jgi:hypothetical protein